MPAEHLPTDKSSKEQQERAIARRQLLKILVAAGGVFTASSVLPGKWIRPIVELGVLPSHAQASVIPRPLCYTPTPSPTPWPIPRCYTATPSSTATPVPAPSQARRQLLDRLLAEGRFPPDITDDL